MKNQTKGDKGNVHRTGDTVQRSQSDDRTKDLRKANENIRKSQGDDSGTGRTGNRPVFDRDR